MTVDFSNDVILLTCANGKQCSHLIPFLLPKWKHLRLAVKSESSRQALEKKYGPTWQSDLKSNIDVVLADLAQPDDCYWIMEGVTAVYHVGPGFHPRETEIGSVIPYPQHPSSAHILRYNITDAALHHHISHFIYSSVLHPILRKLMNHDCKRYIEEYLTESGLPYTILQPSHFMDMFPLLKLLAEENPTYTARWDPDVRFSYTSLHDLGEATAKILEQREQHFYATYQMVSTGTPMGYNEVCKIASKVIGKEIRVETIPFQKTMEGSAEGTLGLSPGEYARDGVQRMLLYYNYRGLVGSTNVMRWVLEREPLSWERWCEMTIKEVEGK